MTTKKYVDYIQKQCKTINNISFEPIFNEYIVSRNAKRIGVIIENKLYLLSTENLKELFPNAVEENPFGWAYYKLIHIEDTENVELLRQTITTVYDDLYFQKELVCDISYLLKANKHYSDAIAEIYKLHVTFLHFCYEKGLLKINPLDKQNRILHMNFINNNLTEKGAKIFSELYDKWLVYTDKNDEKTDERITNLKILEKNYKKLLNKNDIIE